MNVLHFTHTDLSADAALVLDEAKPDGVSVAHKGKFIQLPQAIQQLFGGVPSI